MRTAARIIDASANRAREGLRVMEDVARFGLDDERLTAELKALRHDLMAAVAGLGAIGLGRGALLGGRDTPGDVGTGLTTEGEGRRRDLFEAAAAAAGRTAEALRSIEETAKAIGGGERAGTFERLRYRVYEAERQLGAAHLSPQWRLCVIVTEALCARRWEDVAHAAIEGGADCLQLREKGLLGGELVRRTRRLLEIARSAPEGARPAVIVNDRADVAVAAGADGVHVGQRDLDPAACRAVMGLGAWVGVSTTTFEQAARAAGGGGPVSIRASYCGIGAMFPTTTKTDPTLAGPEFARAYLQNERTRGVPHLAIGGISVERIGELTRVGVRGIAVSGAVCRAGDPAGVCRALRAGLEAGLAAGPGAGPGTERGAGRASAAGTGASS